jgi:hypothetical protein
MSLPQGWETWLLVVLVLVALFWNMSRRRKRQSSGNTRVDAASGVLIDVNDNLRVMEERLTNFQSKKKFTDRNWKIYQNQLEFLDPPILTALKDAFATAADLNSRIDSARKNKAMSTLQDMPLEKLRDPLNKGKEGLTTWLRSNYQTEMQSKPRSGCLGM